MSSSFDLTALSARETNRQRNTLNLIASENYPSPQTLALLGSAWGTKYAEGQPGKRYYAGNELADVLEKKTQDLALEVFQATGYGVNLQVLSGSPANATVYHAVLEPQDLVLSLSLAEGGHLSHLHQTSVYNKYYRFAHYRLKEIAPDSFVIDEDDYRQKLQTLRPKLVILGFSAYPPRFDFAKCIRLAHEQGALVLADIAHINGLVAAGVHPTPFAKGVSGADFVTMTTHKTLRGPRGGVLFAKQEGGYLDKVNRAVFPGSFGGPHLQKIAAIARTLQEITGQEVYPDKRSFGDYARAVLANCKALENALKRHGVAVVSPTQTHLCLIRLPETVNSLHLQKSLEKTGLISNRNMLPNDPKTAWIPSGMRFGSAALTSRGATTTDFENIAEWISWHIFEPENEKLLAKAKQEAGQLAQRLAWYL